MTNKNESLLRVSNLETSFFTKTGVLRAVDGISFEIGKSETLGIVGESGCGKSVTSFSIMGLLSEPGKVTAGEIFFKDQDLLKLSSKDSRKIRGKSISMIFQEPMTALNPVLTIGTQICEQILAHETVTKKDAEDRAIALLSRVGIPSPERRVLDYPHQLSGGMRQRAMIAMALSCQPELLICDEPTTALDVTIQAQILDLLQTLQEEFQMSIQFITHDLGVISEIADRVIVMYAGRIVEKATCEQIFRSPRHPYTVGLLESIPRMDTNVKRLHTIPGSVPSLSSLPSGCRFQNRCPNASDLCKHKSPVFTEISKEHYVACHYPT